MPERTANLNAGLLSAVLEREPVAIAVYDVEQRHVYVNPAFEALKPGEPMLGRTNAEVWPEFADRVPQSLSRVLETGEPGIDTRLVFDEEVNPGEHELRYRDLHVERFIADDQPYLLGVVRDTTAEVEAKQLVAECQSAQAVAEDELDSVQVLLRVADVLAKRHELGELLVALAELMLGAIGHKRVGVFTWDEERREGTVAASAGSFPFPVGTVMPFESMSPVAKEAIRALRTTIIDYDELGLADRGYRRALKSHVALDTPILAKGRFIGWFNIDDPGERSQFTRHEIELVERIAAQVGVAIENARLFDADLEGNARLSTLQEASTLVTTSLNVSEVVGRAMPAVGRALGVVAAVLWTLDRASGRLQIGGVIGLPRQFFDDYAEGIGVESSLQVARAVRENIPVVHSDVSESEKSGPVTESFRPYGVQLGALIALPLRARGETVGALALAWPEPRRFSASEIAFHTSLANTLGIAVDNARLFEEQREMARLAEALAAIDHDVHATLSVETILDRVVMETAQALRCDSGALLMLEQDCWVMRSIFRLPHATLGEAFTDEQVPFAVVVAESQRPLAMPNTSRDLNIGTTFRSEYGVRSAVAVPIVVREEAIGVLFFADRGRLHDFSEREIDFVRHLSMSLGLALANASLFQEEHRMQEELREGDRALHETLDGIVGILASTVSLRDPYTTMHEEGVARLACAIGKGLGLDTEAVEGLRMAALLHDIGKISVPVEILSRPTPLNDNEMGIIRRHPALASELLERVKFSRPVATIVRQHHERLDGSGYPDGIIGDDMLLESKILAVADVVEAMSSDRPYRPALGIDAALAETEQYAGVLYDAQVVTKCMEIVRAEGRLP